MKLRDQAAHDWTVTEPKVAEAVGRLVVAAHPRKLFLFGSYVRNEVGPGRNGA